MEGSRLEKGSGSKGAPALQSGSSRVALASHYNNDHLCFCAKLPHLGLALVKVHCSRMACIHAPTQRHGLQLPCSSPSLRCSHWVSALRITIISVAASSQLFLTKDIEASWLRFRWRFAMSGCAVL